MGAACSACGGGDESIQILARKHRRLKPPGRTRRSWEDNIKMDVREIGWSGVDWISLAQDRDKWPAVVKTVMLLRLPQDEGNFLTS
jgi:hypothetical protein